MTILAGALLGLLGSAHCIGMCGPLVLSLGAPRHDVRLAVRLAQVGIYHLGRIATYALLGVAAGLAGGLFAMAGLGRTLAVAGGALLVAAALAPALVRRSPSLAGPWIPVAARAGAAARRWQHGHPFPGRFAAGLANGLLPCGMVYAALAAALAAGSVAEAALTMTAFGAGTTPALAVLSLSAAQIPIAWRRRVSRAAPAGLAIVGLLLIVRGMTPPPAAAAGSPPSVEVSGHGH
jgi:hypothetical protein